MPLLYKLVYLRFFYNTAISTFAVKCFEFRWILVLKKGRQSGIVVQFVACLPMVLKVGGSNHCTDKKFSTEKIILNAGVQSFDCWLK
jgi:hypothetical protein